MITFLVFTNNYTNRKYLSNFVARNNAESLSRTSSMSDSSSGLLLPLLNVLFSQLKNILSRYFVQELSCTTVLIMQVLVQSKLKNDIYSLKH